MFCIGFASTVKAEDTDITAIENVIYMAPQQEVSAGETATLSICMKNNAPIRGFQFRICLPEGVTVVKNNKGRIQASLNPDRLDADDEHALSVSEQSDGSILLLCGSLYDENLIGNDGEIATMKVEVSNNVMNGSHPILLKNIKLTETDISKYYVTELIESTLNITNGGDVLNDDEFIVQIQGGLDMLFKITDEGNKKCQIGNGTGAAISISEPRTVVLPKTANGYSVTAIAANAFAGTFVGTVHIPNTITSIGENAFKDCSYLDAIYSYIGEPFDIPANVFTGISSHASLTIKYGTKEAYLAAQGWNVFSRISDNMAIKNGIRYSLRGANPDKGDPYTAWVKSSKWNEYEGDVVIPEVLTFTVETFTVVGIDDGAFEDSYITSVSIPNTIRYIDDHAFYGCNNLTTVVVNINSPLTIDGSTFSNRANATLYVPAGAKSAYQAATYWKDFKAIKEFPDADVNQDGVVNVVDVVDIARYVVDDPSPSFDKFLADLNGSGEVSVTDAVVLVNEIAGETSWARRSEQSTAANDQLLLFANADNSLSLHLEGDGQYTAFQLDLHLPADVDLTKALLNAQRKQKHQLLYNKVGEGVYRIIGLSTSGRTFLGNAGELLNMQLDDFATEDVMMDNIHFITPAAADVLFEPVMLTTETTGIAAVNKADEADYRVVYNLNGQRITAPRKGLNIVNGKKLIVK